jgi:hypothetical protein
MAARRFILVSVSTEQLIPFARPVRGSSCSDPSDSDSYEEAEYHAPVIDPISDDETWHREHFGNDSQRFKSNIKQTLKYHLNAAFQISVMGYAFLSLLYRGIAGHFPWEYDHIGLNSAIVPQN